MGTLIQSIRQLAEGNPTVAILRRFLQEKAPYQVSGSLMEAVVIGFAGAGIISLIEPQERDRVFDDLALLSLGISMALNYNRISRSYYNWRLLQNAL